MTFELYPLRFHFVARDSISFPAGKSANLLRGAFGITFRRICGSSEVYSRVFEPEASLPGPSGLKNLPRPFVLRTRHLDGARIESGQKFWFGLNLFLLCDPPIQELIDTFAELGRVGLGTARSKSEFVSVEHWKGSLNAPFMIPLLPPASPVHRIRVEFVTPTELKSDEGVVSRPDFGVLFARARDRISTLRALYGAGPLDIDFRESGERAARIGLERFELQRIDVARRSSRTGQVHGIGGFAGWAEYGGELAEFVPYLEAARWTGVGRQCVWGKGELCISTCGADVLQSR